MCAWGSLSASGNTWNHTHSTLTASHVQEPLACSERQAGNCQLFFLPISCLPVFGTDPMCVLFPRGITHEALLAGSAYLLSPLLESLSP